MIARAQEHKNWVVCGKCPLDVALPDDVEPGWATHVGPACLDWNFDDIECEHLARWWTDGRGQLWIECSYAG